MSIKEKIKLVLVTIIGIPVSVFSSLLAGLCVIGMFLLVVLVGIVCFVIKWSIVAIGVLLILKLIAVITGNETIGCLFDTVINYFKG